MRRSRHFSALLLLTLGSFAAADGPGDNLADKVRPIPAPGVPVPPDVRDELTGRLATLTKEIDDLRSSLAKKPDLLGLLPDVEIFSAAVHTALKYDEFHNPKEFDAARRLLAVGSARAAELKAGTPSWTTATGPVPRGYRSNVDGSVQPYVLYVPKSYRPDTSDLFRLDCWCHGREEVLNEVNFLDGRSRSTPEFTPRNAFVLLLFGRYCNAAKMAGEVDLFEALGDVQKHYPIDEDRLVIRGFSMGGAATWHFAVHYPGVWAAAAPGAGFSETPDFLKVFQNEAVTLPPYQRTLLHWYDCTDWAVNLSNCPTVAYSGEVDKQKQAADIMAKALAAEGIELTHLIGPKTGHSYHPVTKAELSRRVDAIVTLGRDPAPREINFTTYTLRYNRMKWVTVDGLEKHWHRARVHAEVSDGGDTDGIEATTANVSAVTFDLPPGRWQLGTTGKTQITLDGQRLDGPMVQSDRSLKVRCRKTNGTWAVVTTPDDDGTPRKAHGLQGPIDDAFMDSFMMVQPTGQAGSAAVEAWTRAEFAHAVDHWRKQFRGQARVKPDTQITDADVAAHNLILFGDPASNAVLGKIAAKLPVRWEKAAIRLGSTAFPSETNALILIAPNPLNPAKYVVLNSGFTFREYDYLNNARQIPKLPDYAVIDVTTPRTSQGPGKVVNAGFFDERWRLAE